MPSVFISENVAAIAAINTSSASTNTGNWQQTSSGNHTAVVAVLPPITAAARSTCQRLIHRLTS